METLPVENGQPSFHAAHRSRVARLRRNGHGKHPASLAPTRSDRELLPVTPFDGGAAAIFKRPIGQGAVGNSGQSTRHGARPQRDREPLQYDRHPDRIRRNDYLAAQENTRRLATWRLLEPLAFFRVVPVQLAGYEKVFARHGIGHAPIEHRQFFQPWRMGCGQTNRAARLRRCLAVLSTRAAFVSSRCGLRDLSKPAKPHDPGTSRAYRRSFNRPCLDRKLGR